EQRPTRIPNRGGQPRATGDGQRDAPPLVADRAADAGWWGADRAAVSGQRRARRAVGHRGAGSDLGCVAELRFRPGAAGGAGRGAPAHRPRRPCPAGGGARPPGAAVAGARRSRRRVLRRLPGPGGTLAGTHLLRPVLRRRPGGDGPGGGPLRLGSERGDRAQRGPADQRCAGRGGGRPLRRGAASRGARHGRPAAARGPAVVCRCGQQRAAGSQRPAGRSDRPLGHHLEQLPRRDRGAGGLLRGDPAAPRPADRAAGGARALSRRAVRDRLHLGRNRHGPDPRGAGGRGLRRRRAGADRGGDQPAGRPGPTRPGHLAGGGRQPGRGCCRRPQPAHAHGFGHLGTAAL
ncbi:MAG: hypothetical protein AVDCRST_MAG61-348, partial [uncultured Friedmanniella sp.]